MSLLAVTIYGYGFLGLIVFSLWVAFKVSKRTKEKIGCLIFGYISLVVFCIGLLTSAITILFFSYSFNKVETLAFGKSYPAKIVDYNTIEGTDDEGNTTYSHYPILEFTTDEGKKITRQSDESDLTGKSEKGSARKVFYYEENDKLTTIGASTGVAICGMLTMSVVLIFSFTGIIMYAMGKKMDKFWKICQSFGFKFFIPFLMILFDVLLIYAFFYGNTEALWVKLLLGFFITALSLAIWGYIKMIIKKGTPKMRRVSATRWVGDWDD